MLTCFTLQTVIGNTSGVHRNYEQGLPANTGAGRSDYALYRGALHVLYSTGNSASSVQNQEESYVKVCWDESTYTLAMSNVNPF